jgi:hypothetical protein
MNNESVLDSCIERLNARHGYDVSWIAIAKYREARSTFGGSAVSLRVNDGADAAVLRAIHRALIVGPIIRPINGRGSNRGMARIAREKERRQVPSGVIRRRELKIRRSFGSWRSRCIHESAYARRQRLWLS